MTIDVIRSTVGSGVNSVGVAEQDSLLDFVAGTSILRLDADESRVLRIGVIQLEDDDIATRCVGEGLNVQVVKPSALIANFRNVFVPRHTVIQAKLRPVHFFQICWSQIQQKLLSLLTN